MAGSKGKVDWVDLVIVGLVVLFVLAIWAWGSL
jgi:hypothetical protein